MELFSRLHRLFDNKVLRLDYLLHSIAVALDNRGFGMVKKAIQQRRSKSAVVIEDFWPFFENPVSGDDKWAFFIAVTDDLKE